MKKITAILMMVIMSVGMLSGCSKKEAESTRNDAGNNTGYATQRATLSSDQSAAKESFTVDMAATQAPSYGYVSEDGVMDQVMQQEIIMNSEIQHDFNTEEYDSFTENGFLAAQLNPLSTFSADVDTASYSILRRMIQNGYVDSSAVRIEEMLNYFKYDYQQPTAEHPFGVTTEIADCPWNPDTKLMLVGIQTENVDFSDTKPSNLVFLIDVSGSMMDEDKLPLAQKAFALLAENLTEKDRISIVTYASSDDVVLRGVDGTRKEEIMEAVNGLTSYGSTNGSRGIQTAYELAQEYFIEGGNNRVILATDGDLNVGVTSEGELTALIEEKKKTGVYLSVLGFGSGNTKDNKMEALADHGNGNYNYIDTILEAKKVLVEELGATLCTVAEDVKFQVEFNAAKVKGYRLIGYDNRLLAAEDFADDTKDGGEVGAGHSVTVLYEIALKDSKQEIPAFDLKYQNTSTTDSQDLLTVHIRYKKPGEKTSILMDHAVMASSIETELSKNLRFAAAVTEFGMLLRNSEFVGSSSYDSVLELLSECDVTNDAYRLELVSLVKQAKNMGRD